MLPREHLERLIASLPKKGQVIPMTERIGGAGMEKVFYIVFKRDGKTVETKAGRPYKDNMTAASAARLRTAMLEGKESTRKEKRQTREAPKVAEAMRPTLSRLFEVYKTSKPDRNWATDITFFRRYLSVFFRENAMRAANRRHGCRAYSHVQGRKVRSDCQARLGLGQAHHTVWRLDAPQRFKPDHSRRARIKSSHDRLLQNGEKAHSPACMACLSGLGG